MLSFLAVAAIGTTPAIASHRKQVPIPPIGYRVVLSQAAVQQYDQESIEKLNAMAEKYANLAADTYGLILDTLKQDHPVKRPVMILVTSEYDGTAATFNSGQGRIIKINANYALHNPDDTGVIVHEMTHVVQAYQKSDPLWLCEGIADYVRWFFYEPDKKRPSPKKGKADARDSYQNSATFLYWVASKYDADLVPKLNWAFQHNAYNEDEFRQMTGRTLNELDEEWKATLPEEEKPKPKSEPVVVAPPPDRAP